MHACLSSKADQYKLLCSRDKQQETPQVASHMLYACIVHHVCVCLLCTVQASLVATRMYKHEPLVLTRVECTHNCCSCLYIAQIKRLNAACTYIKNIYCNTTVQTVCELLHL
jgi:hypothetical protein